MTRPCSRITTRVFPVRKHRVFPSHVDAFGPYLEKRFAEGFTNASQLWREIKQQASEERHRAYGVGCGAASGACETSGTPSHVKKRPPLCLGHVAWLMLKADPQRQRYLKALYRASPELKALGSTARGFFEMIRKRVAAAWPSWLEAAMHSPLASFAYRLERDRSAADAALRLP